jgi:hypothetical protein
LTSTGSLLVPLRNSLSTGSNESTSKRSSFGSRISPSFYLAIDHPTVFDFEDFQTTLDQRELIILGVFSAKRVRSLC